MIECWLVEDKRGGGLTKKPAALVLRHGPGGPPPRPDLDPNLYLSVHGESSGTHLRLSRPRSASSSAPGRSLLSN